MLRPSTIFPSGASDKGKPKGAAGRVALPVTSEPQAHKLRVMELVDAIGFDPVDSGDISDSWRQGPGTPAYCQDFDEAKLKEALAAAQRDQIQQYKHEANQNIITNYPDMAKAQRKAVTDRL